MKKILYSFLIFSSASLLAQKNPATRFAVANDIVGTVDLFTGKENIIQSKQVYKTASSLPQNLKKFGYIADNGLVEYKLKKGYEGQDRLTLAQINEGHGVSKDSPVFVDGYEFSNPDTMIYAEILNNVEVKDNNGKKSVFATSKLK